MSEPTAMHTTEPRARRAFLITLAVTLALKLWLGVVVPITGDEAFFIQWGVYPDWGYYDHPPMIGWWLALLLKLSDAPLVLRLPTIVLSSAIGIGLVDLVRRLAPSRPAAAWLAGAVYLALPVSWIGILVTTDTPLVFFLACSGYAFVRAALEPHAGLRWTAASGALLGLGFLSKYFAVLMGVAYAATLLVEALTRGHWRRALGRLALIVVCALPFVAVNLAYNATHCWNNVMFNLMNRHEDAHASVKTIVVYLVMMAYMLTPWIVWRLWRLRGGLDADAVEAPPGASREAHEDGRRRVLALFAVPLALFLLMSVEKTVGLHWVLGFVPFVFVAVGASADGAWLGRALRRTAWLSLPHALLLAVLAHAPLTIWPAKIHRDLAFLFDAGAIAEAVQRDMPAGGVLMAPAYTPAAILSYHARHYVPVFGPGRFHARQDDIIVDFRAFDGKLVRIFGRDPLPEAAFAPYFSAVRSGSVTVDGIVYHYVDGTGFRYAVYRERVLAEIGRRYYRIPSWLPVWGCPFAERYGLTEACGIRLRGAHD